MFEKNFFGLFLNQRMNVSWHLIICRRKEWDGMGWAGGEFGYHPQLLFLFFYFFGFKITTPIPLNSSFHL